MGTFSYVYHYALEKAGVKVKDATKTLMQLMALPDFENVIYVDVSTIAAKIGITKSAVYQHMAALREAGLITPHEDVRPDSRIVMKWRLCPFLGWKGTGVSLEKYISTLGTNHVFFNYVDPEFKSALEDEIKQEIEFVKVCCND